MIQEAAITPKNENNGSKMILTNILPQFSLMERKRPGRNFFTPFSQSRDSRYPVLLSHRLWDKQKARYL